MYQGWIILFVVSVFGLSLLFINGGFQNISDLFRDIQKDDTSRRIFFTAFLFILFILIAAGFARNGFNLYDILILF